jgi:hypothetical protein
LFLLAAKLCEFEIIFLDSTVKSSICMFYYLVNS